MILLDDRIGSKELLPYFHPYAIAPTLCHLEYGDLAFSGNGPHGTLTIGIERKRIDDLIQSMQTGRLAGHQLNGLLTTYSLVYLIVEGIWRNGTGGELEIMYGHGGWRTGFVGRTVTLYEAIDNFLTTLENSGVRIRRTANAPETVKCVMDLYHYWAKDWSEHHAHRAIYAPVPESPESEGVKLRLVRGPEPNLVTRMAAQIPLIDQRAWQVGRYFHSPQQMVLAPVEEWMKALGIKKGRKTCTDIRDVLEGRNHE